LVFLMKRKLLVAGFALILAVVAVLSAYQIVTSSYSSSVGCFFRKGLTAPYAAGSSVSSEIILPKTSVLTGSFVTNNSVSFYILTSEEYSGQFPSFSDLTSYSYTTGYVPSAMVNVTLPASTYYLLFMFKSSSETIRTPLNVTGFGSKPLSTTLTITQSFIAKPL